MTRIDVHAPKHLITEDYTYVGCGNHAARDLDAYSPGAIIGMVDSGFRFNDVRDGHHCSHCGSFLTYYAVLAHLPTMTMIHVGETCLDNRFSFATAEFHELRRKAKLNRGRVALRDKRHEFLANPSAQTAYIYAQQAVANGTDWSRDPDEESFEHKFVRYVLNYGEASDKFIAAILRSKERAEKREAERAAEALTAKPVIEGRGKITGEILSIKWRDSQFGGCFKITVKDEGGFKVWGTCPASIESAEKGDTITFVATVTKSDDDPTFGFFKRPAGAEILQRKEA